MSGAEELLRVARSQLGYREGANNATKYGAWYGMNNQPWCAMFVSWCADQAGLSRDVIPRFAYVPYGVAFFQKQGRYFPRGADAPKAGDVVFFGSSDHVGIVERVADGMVYSIEGNTSASGNSSNGDGVYRRSRGLRDSWIMGYGRPAFPGEEEEMEIKDLKIQDLDRNRLISVRAVNIEGSNYIRLRDAEKLFPVQVGFDTKAALPTIALRYQGSDAE
ncbi:MAG: CHAP domain-containing protein [Firmicutes bacterium]|nr:CHAP domain-containing protein [Bacillota bacterium]